MKLVYWAISQVAKLVKIDRLVAWLINGIVAKCPEGAKQILQHIQQAAFVALEILNGNTVTEDMVSDALVLLKAWRDGKVDKGTERKVYDAIDRLNAVGVAEEEVKQ